MDVKNWTINVLEMTDRSGISFPVFEWRLNDKQGSLRAWPLQGLLTSEIDGNFLFFQNIEEALAIIAKHGWNKPLYFEKVFKDIFETRRKISLINEKEERQIFDELQKNWEAMILIPREEEKGGENHELRQA
jgi:hypothetical protein